MRARTGTATLLCALLVAPAGGLRAAAGRPAPTVDYNRDVRPILANHCYACHGPDTGKRKAGLRLDRKEDAFKALRRGRRAIVPGDLARSQLHARVSSADETEVMPPPAFGKPLSKGQIDALKRWIEQGASWRQHWAYVAPKRPPLPAVQARAWPRNGLDHFVLARLEKEGLSPSPEADRATLLRRLSFDLTGLPPTPAEVDAFLADRRPDAYERAVERLLASPHYGERMAQPWLDLARYADTNGYHIDNHRDMWKWREWVVGAFNRNLPFDRFTIEQLAGDLLPGATLEQKVASGFNRNTMVNFEGGADPNEYLTKYVIDRVTTTATVWLGTTIGCAECHDHKYDPFTQKEFYQFYAFFHNVPERGLDGQKDNPVPSLRVPTRDYRARKAALVRQQLALAARLREEVARVKLDEAPKVVALRPPPPREVVWVDDDLPPGAVPHGSEGPASWKWVTAPRPVLSGKRASVRSAKGLSQHFFTGAREALRVGAGDKFFAHVYLDPKDPPKEVMLQFHDGTWEHRAYWGANVIPWGVDNWPSRRRVGNLPPAGKWARLEVDAAAVGLKEGAVVHGLAFAQFDGTAYWDKAGLVTRGLRTPAFDSLAVWEQWEKVSPSPQLPKEVRDALRVEPEKRSPAHQALLREHFIRHVYTKTRPVFEPLLKEQERLKKAESDLEQGLPSVMVMEEMARPRDTFVLVRGDFQTKGEKVAPGVPAVLPPLPAGLKADRLALAKWLMLPEHPLTARVTVNRHWEQVFGGGLVKTGEDFGSQGDWPSHPELLDWLAVEFRESGWDVKGFLRLLVTSATYRQSARVTPAHLAKDPENRLLARAPRYRLSAEAVRDNALAISGLLNRALGGPSVKPYQPPGLWEQVAFGGGFSAQTYVQDKGDKLYRRGLYVYGKRSLPHPSLVTFDAPNREVCTDRRPRTNTPLQALVLMNDPIYVECARVLAQRVLHEGGSTTEERLRYAFRLCTARPPRPEELRILRSVFERQAGRYRRDKAAALKLVSVGEAPRPPGLDVSELAAWTAVGNLLLNLDETITRG
jgi:hypothetical protein